MRVTQLEFSRLAAEKRELQKKIKETIDAQDAIVKAYKKALEDLHVTRLKEEQLRKQIDLINCYANNAIAMEAQEIKEIEQAEGSRILTFRDVPKDSFNLHLSPSTQGAFKSYPLETQETPYNIALVASDNS